MKLVTSQLDSLREGGQERGCCLIQDSGICVKNVLGKYERMYKCKNKIAFLKK